MMIFVLLFIFFINNLSFVLTETIIRPISLDYFKIGYDDSNLLFICVGILNLFAVLLLEFISEKINSRILVAFSLAMQIAGYFCLVGRFHHNHMRVVLTACNRLGRRTAPEPFSHWLRSSNTWISHYKNIHPSIVSSYATACVRRKFPIQLLRSDLTDVSLAKSNELDRTEWYKFANIRTVLDDPRLLRQRH